jgi:nicotinate dehydrogenase subunit B
MTSHAHCSRRDFLRAGGALVVGVMLPGAARTALGQTPVGGKPPLTPDELDSWIAVLPDGRVRAFFGKMDMGQGVDVAIGQIVADELDVAFERVDVVMGDTAFTCNQGGASGSTAIQNGGVTLRFAAAEARRVLLERASQKLGTPADKLVVQDGVVSVIGAPDRAVTYGDLIGGQFFQLKLEWNKRYGNPLLAKGQALPKKPSELQGGRPLDSARDRRRQGIRQAEIRHRRQGRWDAPREGATAADGRLRAGQCRRGVDRQHRRGAGDTREGARGGRG